MRTSAFSRHNRPLVVVGVLAVLAPLVFAAGAAAERPGFYSPPSVADGKKVVGSTLVASDGSLRCLPECKPDGPNPENSGRFFQWLVCNGPHGGGKYGPPGGLPDEGGPCPGAVIVKPRTRIDSDSNANRYIVRPEDAGKYIQVEVIAVNYDCGETNYQTGERECRYSAGHGWSSTFGPIAGTATAPPASPGAPPTAAAPVTPPAVAPTYTALPAITGEFEDMQTLTVSNGTWNGTGPLAFAYQWLRCSRANNGCKPIDGATSSTYTLGAADVATRITASVTVSNAGGRFVAAALLTPKIAGAKPRPGNDALNVSQLLPRHRLKVQRVTVKPTRLRPGRPWVARVVVVDRRGFLIEGVEVEIGDGLGDVTSTPVLTDARGLARLRLQTTPFVPLGRLVLTVRAEKPVAENALGPPLATTKRVVVRVSR